MVLSLNFLDINSRINIVCNLYRKKLNNYLIAEINILHYKILINYIKFKYIILLPLMAIFNFINI